MQHDTYNQSISSFVRWASRRIAEEVESNERIEAETGTAEIIKRHNKLPYNLTNQQKREYVDMVDMLRNQKNMNTKSACYKVGMHISTYSQWRKKFGLGKFKPTQK